MHEINISTVITESQLRCSRSYAKSEKLSQDQTSKINKFTYESYGITLPMHMFVRLLHVFCASVILSITTVVLLLVYY